MKIAVCGTSIGEIRREILGKSGEVGKEIAGNGHTLMFGACPGYPYEAAKRAFQSKGRVIGISPAKDREEHISKYNFPLDSMTELKFTGLGIPERNISLVKGSDAVIIISGQIGTLNEFTLAFQEKKPIGILKGSGGITGLLGKITEICNNERYNMEDKIVFNENPKMLVNLLIGANSASAMPKIHFITQGCSNNLRESEIMAGLLKNSGCEIVGDNAKSEVNIINICTVKGDGTALAEIKRQKRLHPDKKLVVAGCITQGIVPKIKAIGSGINLVNTHNLDKIGSAVENSDVEFLGKKYEPKVNLPSVRKNPVIGIVPILNGCNYSCAFCSTKLVKGRLFSYPMDGIRQDVKSHLKAGCREIWITSQDTGAYMVEQGGKSKLVELLDQILSVPVDFKLRLGMMNPGNTITILDGLIEIYKNPKMYKFLHIPVQSGNNEILKLMNRKYDAETFAGIVNAFRKEIPEMTIATDIIVGFPGETEEQFNDTLDLFREIKPDVLNLSMYREREGTIAAKMKQMPERYRKERSRIIAGEFRKMQLEGNRKWIGWKGKALVDEEGKNGTWIGRNYCYKPVVLRRECRLGNEVDVKIADATRFDLRDESLSGNSAAKEFPTVCKYKDSNQIMRKYL